MQTLIAYVIVALAAGWVIWSTFLPRKLKADVRLKLGIKPKRGSGRMPEPVPRRRR